MNALEIKDLYKSYGKREVLRGVGLSVSEGEIFGIAGPNGAGKTTLMECAENLKSSDSGTVKIFGKDVNSYNKKELYNLVGVQLQQTGYPDEAKVIDTVKLFASLYENPIDYRPYLKKFYLDDKEKDYVGKLSGGERQKLSVLLSIIGNPKIVFLDEITTGLDPIARRDMWDIIKALKEDGKTVILSTHYMDEAEYLCDRLAIVYDGVILTIDEPKNIVSKHAKLFNTLEDAYVNIIRGKRDEKEF